ncbi:MAG: hypothetical protein AAGA33_02330 [Pseudomonadota bacterium]
MNKVTELATREEIDDDLRIVDYVAGKLSGAERADFEHRLDSDAMLRAAVDEERELRALLTTPSDGDVPSSAGFEQLREEVEMDATRRFWRSPALAAGVAAMALIALFTLQQPDDVALPITPEETPPPSFTALSESPTPPSDQNRVTIVFAPGVTTAERAVIASQLGFELVGGPNAAGAWTAVTTPGVNRDDLSRWLADPRIDLAEPQRYETP